MSESSAPGPLHGIKILDLSRVLAGPWATQLLGDYGAEVIKIERPGTGDDTRAWGPPWLHPESDSEKRDAAYFLAANRNKRSMTVNIAHPDGVRIIKDLVTGCDVLVENFKVGTMQRYGLDFEVIKRLNPALIYCSISAFGQDGSRSERPGYDAMIQASGGLMSITGEAEGSPQKVGVAIADIMAGMYAATAVLAALVAGRESGCGQHIDIPLYDSQVAWLANQNMNYLIGGAVPMRHGSAHPNLVPYQTFATADGHITVAVGNDRQFANCVQCLGLPHLADDQRFRTNAGRVQDRQALVGEMAARMLQNDSAYWLKILTEAEVPVGPINSIADVLGDEYAKERRMVRKLHHATETEVPTVANPVRFSATAVEYRAAPPVLGQHTREVLAQELDYSVEEIEALQLAGAIGTE